MSNSGEKFEISEEDVLRYSQPGPRYTSYPTVPVWSDNFPPESLETALQAITAKDSVSIYMHIPFCEKLCHFCACNRIIDKAHSLEGEYVKAIREEIDLVASHLRAKAKVSQLHWGGGTPTFLSPAQISDIMIKVRERFEFASGAELSIEVNPVITSHDHVKVLRKEGFWRLSMGVQDFDPEVQDIINRHQTFEQTSDLMEWARADGFTSLNVDLIYGLPRQTQKRFEETLNKILKLRPDRLAVYSFAKVPWKQPFQRRFSDDDLPEGVDKVRLYLLARDILCSNGYEAIGMDHFALPNDELCTAARAKKLHRNFMGYTTQPDAELIGLGLTAISNVKNVYAQNAKTLPSYYDRVRNGKLASVVGCEMTKDDFIRRDVIHSLMCNFELSFETFKQKYRVDFKDYFRPEIEELKPLESDHMLAFESSGLKVIGRGQVLVRNIAMTFDAYLKDGERRFSNTV